MFVLYARSALPLLIVMVRSVSANLGDAACAVQLSRSRTVLGQRASLARGECTAVGEDPYSTGTFVSCCPGLNKCLSNWDGGNYYYRCFADCSDPTSPTPPPTPMPPTPPPTPMPPLGPCLCVFDIDRTLTGQQSNTKQCPSNEVIQNCKDTAYGTGELTLSAVGQTLHGTFCAEQNCYVGVVTAGDASGPDSCERKELAERLADGGGNLTSKDWCGPSKDRDARRSCQGITVTSPLVLGCLDGTKQYAVESIVDWFARTEDVTIPKANVWMFDDRTQNIEPFAGTGMNAIEISCSTRDNPLGTGMCGATSAEIVPDIGVHTCT